MAELGKFRALIERGHVFRKQTVYDKHYLQSRSPGGSWHTHGPWRPEYAELLHGRGFPPSPDLRARFAVERVVGDLMAHEARRIALETYRQGDRLLHMRCDLPPPESSSEMSTLAFFWELIQAKKLADRLRSYR